MGQFGCYLNWPLVFQGFKTFLDPIASASFPIALAIIVWMFRQQLSELIGRIRKLDGFGLATSFEAQVSASNQPDAPTADFDFMGPRDSVFGSKPFPHDVYDAFDNMALETLEQQIAGDAERKLKFAIRMRSISEVARLHEAHYRSMYGSQLRALKELHILNQAPSEHFRQYYQGAAAIPEWKPIYENRSYEEWGQFLINIGYVEVVENSQPQLVRITHLGSHFFLWMAESRVPEFRPF